MIALGLGSVGGQAPWPLGGAPQAQGLRARRSPRPSFKLPECNLLRHCPSNQVQDSTPILPYALLIISSHQERRGFSSSIGSGFELLGRSRSHITDKYSDDTKDLLSFVTRMIAAPRRTHTSEKTFSPPAAMLATLFIGPTSVLKSMP